MRRSSQHPLYHEVAGLLLVGGSILLFLALISYDPGDLPGGLFQASEVAANTEVRNFIGRLGAVAAGLFFFLYGVPAFLIATLLFGLGLLKLLAPERPSLQPGLWMAVLVVCASCISQIQPVFFHDWSQSLNLRPGGAGGVLGYWLGAKWMVPLFGRVGSLILLSFLYFASLILMTGIHPAVVIRRLRELGPFWLERFRQYRAQKAEEKAQQALESALDDEEAERPQPRPARNGGRRSRTPAQAKPAEEETAPAAAEPEPVFDLDRPAPQVIDTTAPSPRKPVPAPPRREKPAALDPFQSADAGADMELYDLPGLDLLEEPGENDRAGGNPNEMLDLQATLIDTLSQFGIPVAPGDITRGPTITRYEVYPAKGIRVDKIVSLERDLARATCAERINILAPIPGKDTVGIEIANARKQKVMLRELLESADWEQTNAKIPLVLGKDVYGKTILGDLAAMPHLLVAGTTGSGKSVCINSIIASIIYRFKPKELRFIMIDPKVVEMQVYNRLPHLAIPVVTDPKKVLLALRWVIDEMEKRYKIFAKAGVRNITTFNARPKPKTQKELDEEAEREEAEREAAKAPDPDRHAPARPPRGGNDKIIDFNPSLRPPWESSPDDEAGSGNGSVVPLPVPPEAGPNAPDEPETAPEANQTPDDEAATPPVGEPETEPEPEDSPEPPARPPVRVRRDDEIEIPVGPMPYIVVIIDELADLMQTAPADVESAVARITQMARAAGIHMIVATQTPRADVITGVIKANIPTRIAFQVASALDSRIILDEKGAERLLGQGDMMYVPPGTSRMTRAQGVFVTDEEIRRLVDFSAAQDTPTFNPEIEERLSGSAAGAEEVSDEDEELVNKCIEIMIQERKVSTSLFQRRLRLGYTRAARVVDILEQRGYVAAGEGAKPREILIDLDTLE